MQWRMRIPFPASGLWVWVWALMVSPLALAQSEQDWNLEGGSVWKSKTLSVGRFFQMGINGQSTPYRTAMDAVEKAAKSGDNTEGETPGDGRQSQMGFDVRPFKVDRQVRRDDKRNALLVIDTISNTQSQENNLQLDYSTPVGSQGGVRFSGTLSQSGEMRDLGNGLPDGTWSAIVMAEKQGTPAVPLFIWGQPDAAWRAVLQDSGSTLRLRYEGVVPANGKVAFLHWIGTAGLDAKVKLERTFDLFIKDGKLIEPGVSAEVAALVVNFKPSSLGATTTEGGAPSFPRAGRLLALDTLTGKLDIKRTDKGLLWMSKDEQITGDISVEKVVLNLASGEKEVPPANIAALRGGAGRGRDHRLYLRDGSVLTGRVRLIKGALKGDLGELALDADAMELLTWPVSTEDGRVPETAAEFVQYMDGTVRWLAKGEPVAMDLVASFGKLKISSDELWTLGRRTDPPYCMVATLTDGSRIQGVVGGGSIRREVVGDGPSDIALPQVVRWGAVEAALKEMTGGPEQKESAKPSTGDALNQYCWMRDGSLLVGALQEDETLRVRTSTGVLSLKPDAVARVFWDFGAGSEAALELGNGTKVRGEILNENLTWKLDKQTVSLPVGLITEIVRKAKS